MKVGTFLREGSFPGINETRSNGWTLCKAPTFYPLHAAADVGDAQMVAMLLKEGADPTLQTSVGKTALNIAEDRDRDGSHDAVVRLLGGKLVEGHKLEGTAAQPRIGGARICKRKNSRCSFIED